MPEVTNMTRRTLFYRTYRQYSTGRRRNRDKVVSRL